MNEIPKQERSRYTPDKYSASFAAVLLVVSIILAATIFAVFG